MSCIRYSEQVCQRTRICPFIRCSQVNKSRVSELNYERFYLAEKTNNECMVEFRFYSEGIYELVEQMQLPDEIAIYYGLVGASVTALCLYFKRYDYPCRYGDLFFYFILQGRFLSNHTMEMIYDRLHNLLSRYNHNLLSPQKLLQKDLNYQENTSKPSRTSCCLRRRQIAVTNIVDFGATSVSSLTGMRSRHVTKSNGVVEPKSSIRKLPISEPPAPVPLNKGNGGFRSEILRP